jgi:uncharacterized protein YdeI (YjbR/CyaY-like superfamily)
MEKLPADLEKVLSANPEAKAKWRDLTPIARRDFMSWITSAKQPETRKRRVESVPSRLASGKRRPCCYAVVPMNLYKALGDLPKAKAQWKDLTSDERRDFTDWINEAKGAQAHAERIEKTCVMLLRGKRNP